MKTEKPRNKAIEIAKQMLNDQVNLIEGCRAICSISYEDDDPNENVYLPFVAFESETDHIPIGKARLNCSQEHIKKLDNEVRNYILERKADIYNACQELIRKFT